MNDVSMKNELALHLLCPNARKVRLTTGNRFLTLHFQAKKNYLLAKAKTAKIYHLQDPQQVVHMF